MADVDGEIVEAPLEKLRRLAELRARLEERQREIARNAPPRPRPWHQEARADQLPPPGDWSTWLALAGRGWGKTRAGAEWLAEQAARNPETQWAVIAPTWRDVRTVCIEGSSGLLKSFLPGEIESTNLSELTIRLTNGSRIYGYSADRPDRLRGTNLSGAWLDEAAAMPQVDDLFNEALMPALRIGTNPRLLITTTPRPIKLLKELLAREEDGSVAVVRGRTWDNAKNLSRAALATLKARYEGTRLGRQELEGELLEDIDGALWNHTVLDQTRIDRMQDVPQLARIVVGIDPAVTSGEKADYTGIVVCGKSHDGHLYVLEDCTLKGSPHTCMSKAVDAYHRWKADRIVGEVNNGGDYLETVLRTVDTVAAYKTVRATRGKQKRAEPISALWEQGRGHIVGLMAKLEDELCTYVPDVESGMHDDRLDAMVWAATELQVGASAMIYLSAISRMCSRCEMPNKKVSTVCRGCGAELTNAEPLKKDA